MTKTKKSQGFPEQPGPLYDEVKPGPRYTDVPSETSSDALVEMKMNIAYGPKEHAVAAGDNEIGKILMHLGNQCSCQLLLHCCCCCCCCCFCL